MFKYWNWRRRTAAIVAILGLIGAVLFLLRARQPRPVPDHLVSPPLVWHTIQSPAGMWATLDVPGDVTRTEVSGINNAGQIVGLYTDHSMRDHAFVFAHGIYQTLNPPNGDFSTEGSGINNHGDIVGDYVTFGSPKARGHGFLLSQGRYSTIDAPHAINGTFLSAINDKGQIVGFYYDAKLHPHGFLWQDGKFSPVLLSAGALLGPTGINDAGRIVGEEVLPDKTKHHSSSGQHDYIGISNLNEVGTYRDDKKHLHGFLFHSGVFTNIDIPSTTDPGTPWGVNDSGEIVGTYYDSNNYNNPSHGFLFIPRTR